MEILDPPMVQVRERGRDVIIFNGETYSVQVSDGNRRWKTTRITPPQRLSRHIWIEYRGPIPEGHEIHHRNEITTDDRLNNYSCLTKANHARGHGMQRNHLAEYTATIAKEVVCRRCGNKAIRRSGHASFCSKACKVKHWNDIYNNLR
jgi:hypothetical protein